MKKTIFVLISTLSALCFLSSIIHAKDIVAAECYWDTDPGQGNGFPMSGTFGDSAATVNLNGLSTSGLSLGTHVLFVRMLDSDGLWGDPRGYFVNIALPAQGTITDAEYFIDNDPGAGLGEPLEGTFGTQQVNVSATSIFTGDLSLGTHTVFVRMKNEMGEWGPVRGHSLNIALPAQGTVTDAEYFIDNDPGAGLGEPLEGTFGTQQVNVSATGISTGELPLGTHTIFVRMKNDAGEWGPVRGHSLNIALPAQGTITEAEYFIDDDPGAGLGEPLEGNFGTQQVNVSASGISTGDLSLGTHTVFVRMKNDVGEWGPVRGHSLNIGYNYEGVHLTAAELFFDDDDPGVGVGIPMEALDGAFDEFVEDAIAQAISTGTLDPGTHTAFVRMEDNVNGWGEPSGALFDVEVFEPNIYLSQTSFDFGLVVYGTTATLLVTIENTGTGDLIISDVTSSNSVFSWYNPMTLVIAPGTTETITIAFTPDETGAAEGMMYIYSNDPQSPTEITVEGAVSFQTEFEFGVDDYSFQNPVISEGGNWFVNYTTFLSAVGWDVLTFDKEDLAFYYFMQKNLNPIGNCYGMSLTSIMYFHYEDLIPIPNATTYQLTYAQALPNIVEIQNDIQFTNKIIYYAGDAICGQIYSQMFLQLIYLKESLSNENPTMGHLWKYSDGSGGAHSVVCVGFDDFGNEGQSTLYIYDNNRPDTPNIPITFTPSAGNIIMTPYTSLNIQYNAITFMDPEDAPVDQAIVIDLLNYNHSQHLQELSYYNKIFLNSSKSVCTETDQVDNHYVIDNYDRHLGWMDGIFVNEIEGSAVVDSFSLGVNLPDSLIYTVEFESLNDDTLLFAISIPDILDEDVIHAAGFDSALVYPNSWASFTFSQQEISELFVDLDGNGSPDTTIGLQVDTVLTLTSPDAPQNLVGNVVSQRVADLSWDDMSTSEFGFNIYDSTSAIGEYAIRGIVPANETQFTDTMLVSDIDHYIKVCAYNAGGLSEPSNILLLTTPPMPIPTLLAPEDSAVFIEEEVSLSWSSVEDAVSYHLQVAADSGFTELLMDVDTLMVTEYTLPDSATIFGWHHWRIKAADCVPNWSEWSEVRTFNIMLAWSITLTPLDTLIQIPATGGSFDYNIAVANNTASATNVDIWCDVTLPNGNLYGPVLGPINLTLPGGFSGDRDRTQAVPGGAPEGDYGFNGYVGIYPDSIWAEDNFPFEKLSTGDGEWVESWENNGEPFEEWMLRLYETIIPEVYSLEQNFPNPFNSLTTIKFGLPEAGWVTLDIYNLLGQRVVQLVNGNRDVGYHRITWDTSKLGSGIYFYRIKVDDFTAVKKMVLVK